MKITDKGGYILDAEIRFLIFSLIIKFYIDYKKIVHSDDFYVLIWTFGCFGITLVLNRNFSSRKIVSWKSLFWTTYLIRLIGATRANQAQLIFTKLRRKFVIHIKVWSSLQAIYSSHDLILRKKIQAYNLYFKLLGHSLIIQSL